ncbi:MAG: ATP-binding protein, partial [Bdellovibrionales bacterium]
ITVKDLDRAVLLKVSDNGKGIPPEVLKKLGSENISYGKTGSASGSGIGVYHAKKIIESLGGKFNVLSNLGQGTQVDIILPKAVAPAWFFNAMILPFGTKIYCLDDDLTIHQIWQSRLTSLPADKNKIEFMSFTSAQEFKSYYHKVIKAQPAQTQIFLIDFELLNQGTNGLEVIEELKIHQIHQNVVLVTSRYDEPEIRNKCERFNIKLLPKSLAGSVPIELVLPKEKYDWILIDDDELIHMSWQLAAHEYNKKFLGFKTSQEFMKIQKNIELDSAIYIDSNLGGDVRGELVAKQLFDLGFHELYLATGSSPESFEPMYFIKDIVGKMPPAG